MLQPAIAANGLNLEAEAEEGGPPEAEDTRKRKVEEKGENTAIVLCLFLVYSYKIW